MEGAIVFRQFVLVKSYHVLLDEEDYKNCDSADGHAYYPGCVPIAPEEVAVRKLHVMSVALPQGIYPSQRDDEHPDRAQYYRK